ncbi:hypothetical protein M405DRAFT_833851 [Rhizopogon salebrosus TDB-379]|nr:hypothetical protein M405DRAFT_833851 [Rhizopogon salebrosus TDB-379]
MPVDAGWLMAMSALVNPCSLYKSIPSCIPQTPDDPTCYPPSSINPRPSCTQI